MNKNLDIATHHFCMIICIYMLPIHLFIIVVLVNNIFWCRECDYLHRSKNICSYVRVGVTSELVCAQHPSAWNKKFLSIQIVHCEPKPTDLFNTLINTCPNSKIYAHLTFVYNLCTYILI